MVHRSTSDALQKVVNWNYILSTTTSKLEYIIRKGSARKKSFVCEWQKDFSKVGLHCFYLESVKKSYDEVERYFYFVAWKVTFWLGEFLRKSWLRLTIKSGISFFDISQLSVIFICLSRQWVGKSLPLKKVVAFWIKKTQ